MRLTTWTTFASILIGAALVLALAGCGGETLVAYTGGGLPPGEPDIGGVVVASADGDVAAAQASGDDVPEDREAIVGAEVGLVRGQRVVGRAVTGEGGYFRFQHPATGNYAIVVEPPEDRVDLRGARRNVSHVGGQQTFVTIELPRADQAAVDPGPGPGR